MKRIATAATFALAVALLAASVCNPAGGQGASRDERKVIMLGIWDRVMPLMDRVSRESGIGVQTLKPRELLDGGVNALEGVDLIYILNFQPGEALELKELFADAKQRFADLRIVPLDHRDSHDELENAGLIDQDEKVREYWRANGAVNLRRLLAYTGVTYLNLPGKIEPPLIIPDSGYYHPDHADVFSDFELYRRETNWKLGSPVAVLLMHQSFWITEDTKVINAEIKALEDQGFNVAAVFAETHEKLREMIRTAGPDVIVEDRHGSTWEGEGKKTFLEEMDVPYLRPISMLGYTIEDWEKDPRGLSYRDFGSFLINQETKGTIEPIVVGGLKASVAGFRMHEPMYERISHFAERASSWIQLRRKKNADKRIVIFYYNKGLGKDDLMRGSPTGAFLDGPESLARFLPRMKQEGYKVDPVPADAETILQLIGQRGRNIGPWAQGELEQVADMPGTVLVSKEEYESWYNTKLSADLRARVEQHFGPAPGKLMVVNRNGRDFIVLPNILLGNVLLAPQPVRGEKEDEKLLHSRDVPPPHNYLAFYWWLEEVYHADAVLHWGTHGSLELLPGKEAGLSRDDWPDICAGTMPVINPWIMDNIAEATLSRRRSYAAVVDHVPPPSVDAGLPNEMADLHLAIHKFKSLEPGLLREEFRKEITKLTVKARVDETLKIEGFPARKATDDEIQTIDDYTHVVEASTTPQSLHILGTSPTPDVLIPYLVTCLGREFLERFAELYPPPKGSDPGHRDEWARERAEEMLFDCVIGDKEPPENLKTDFEFARELTANLRLADVEITNIFRALRGGYIPPGPGPDPARNSNSIPAGRNLYGVNPEEIPTRPSWEVAKRLIDEMLKTKSPKKVGFDLNGMNTMRDFGVVEAQILYLMGVEPIWDRNNLVVDVELMSADELGRPRIDVFIAMGGQYKENFGSRVKLLDKAVKLVSELDEQDNHVRKGTENLRRRLMGRGYSEERAELLSSARIFGTKPGNMSGTHVLYLVPRSGAWDSDDEINSVYIDNMSFAYTGDVWGEQIDGLYEEAIQDTDTIIRVWASNMTSQLSNHHAYEYLGGLSMAIKKLTGREPDALIADVRDPHTARMRQFDEVLATNLRTELLNQNWIDGMKEHDYAGAGHMAELVKNTFGWDVMRSSSVTDGVWEDIYETYVNDKYDLKLREWFEKTNPHALQEIAATMLEAARKEYWNADEETLEALSRLYAESVVKFGPSSGLMSGGNEKLDAEVMKRLNAPGDKPLVDALKQALEHSKGARPAERVRGPVLEQQKPDSENTRQASVQEDVFPRRIAILAAVVLGTLFLVGLLLRPSTESDK